MPETAELATDVVDENFDADAERRAAEEAQKIQREIEEAARVALQAAQAAQRQAEQAQLEEQKNREAQESSTLIAHSNGISLAPHEQEVGTLFGKLAEQVLPSFSLTDSSLNTNAEKKEKTEPTTKGAEKTESKIENSTKPDESKKSFTGDLTSPDGKQNIKIVNGTLIDESGKSFAHINNQGRLQFEDSKLHPDTNAASQYKGWVLNAEENGHKRVTVLDDNTSNGKTFLPDEKTGQPREYDVRLGMVIDKKSGEQIAVLTPPHETKNGALEGGSLTYINKQPPENVRLQDISGASFKLDIVGSAGSREIQGVSLGAQRRSADGRELAPGFINLQDVRQVEEQRLKQAEESVKKDKEDHKDYVTTRRTANFHGSEVKTDFEKHTQSLSNTRVDLNATKQQIEQLFDTGKLDPVVLQKFKSINSHEQELRQLDPLVQQKMKLNDFKSSAELPSDTSKLLGTATFQKVDKNGDPTKEQLPIKDGVLYSADGKEQLGTIINNNGSAELKLTHPKPGQPEQVNLSELQGVVWNLNWQEGNLKRHDTLVSLGPDGICSINQLQAQAMRETIYAQDVKARSTTDETTKALNETTQKEQTYANKLARIAETGTISNADIQLLTKGPAEFVRADANKDQVDDKGKKPIAPPRIDSDKTAETVNGDFRLSNRIFDIKNGDLYEVSYNNGTKELSEKPVGKMHANYSVELDGKTLDLAKQDRVLMQFTVGNDQTQHRLIGTGSSKYGDYGFNQGGLVNVEEMNRVSRDAIISTFVSRDDYMKDRSLISAALDKMHSHFDDSLKVYEQSATNDHKLLNQDLTRLFAEGFDPSKCSNKEFDDRVRLTQMFISAQGITIADSQKDSKQDSAVQHTASESFLIAGSSLLTFGGSAVVLELANAAKVANAAKLAAATEAAATTTEVATTTTSIASGTTQIAEAANATKVAAVSQEAITTFGLQATTATTLSGLNRAVLGKTETSDWNRDFAQGGFEGLTLSTGGKVTELLKDVVGPAKVLGEVGNAAIQSTGFTVAHKVHDGNFDDFLPEVALGTAAFTAGHFGGKVTNGLTSRLFGETSLVTTVVGDSFNAATNGMVAATPTAFEEQRAELAKHLGLKDSNQVSTDLLLANFDSAKFVSTIAQQGLETAFVGSIMSAVPHLAVETATGKHPFSKPGANSESVVAANEGLLKQDVPSEKVTKVETKPFESEVKGEKILDKKPPALEAYEKAVGWVSDHFKEFTTEAKARAEKLTQIDLAEISAGKDENGKPISALDRVNSDPDLNATEKAKLIEGLSYVREHFLTSGDKEGRLNLIHTINEAVAGLDAPVEEAARLTGMTPGRFKLITAIASMASDAEKKSTNFPTHHELGAEVAGILADRLGFTPSEKLAVVRADVHHQGYPPSFMGEMHFKMFSGAIKNHLDSGLITPEQAAKLNSTLDGMTKNGKIDAIANPDHGTINIVDGINQVPFTEAQRDVLRMIGIERWPVVLDNPSELAGFDALSKEQQKQLILDTLVAQHVAYADTAANYPILERTMSAAEIKDLPPVIGNDSAKFLDYRKVIKDKVNPFFQDGTADKALITVIESGMSASEHLPRELTQNEAVQRRREELKQIKVSVDQQLDDWLKTPVIKEFMARLNIDPEKPVYWKVDLDHADKSQQGLNNREFAEAVGNKLIEFYRRAQTVTGELPGTAVEKFLAAEAKNDKLTPPAEASESGAKFVSGDRLGTAIKQDSLETQITYDQKKFIDSGNEASVYDGQQPNTIVKVFKDASVDTEQVIQMFEKLRGIFDGKSGIAVPEVIASGKTVDGNPALVMQKIGDGDHLRQQYLNGELQSNAEQIGKLATTIFESLNEAGIRIDLHPKNLIYENQTLYMIDPSFIKDGSMGREMFDRLFGFLPLPKASTDSSAALAIENSAQANNPLATTTQEVLGEIFPGIQQRFRKYFQPTPADDGTHFGSGTPKDDIQNVLSESTEANTIKVNPENKTTEVNSLDQRVQYYIGDDGLKYHTGEKFSFRSNTNNSIETIARDFKLPADYFANKFRNGPVLEISTGDNATFLNELKSRFPNTKFVGVDINPSERGVVYADANKLPFRDGEFKTVVHNNGVISWATSQTPFNEAMRVLDPKEGKLIITYISRDNIEGLLKQYQSEHPEVDVVLGEISIRNGAYEIRKRPKLNSP